MLDPVNHGSPRTEAPRALPSAATQTATSPAHQSGGWSPAPRAACGAGLRRASAADCLEGARRAAAAARATRRGTRTRGASEQHQRYLREREAGVYAVTQLAHRIHRSLPAHQPSTRTSLRNSWCQVHRRAADIALRQAHQSIRRLGLTHVTDRDGFLRAHVGWYWTFCDLSAWLLGEPSVSLGWSGGLPHRGEAQG